MWTVKIEKKTLYSQETFGFSLIIRNDTNEDVLTLQKLCILDRLPNTYIFSRIPSIQTNQTNYTFKLSNANPPLIPPYIEQL